MEDGCSTSSRPTPAIALLKDDHDRVKALFDEFEAARSRPAKTRIVRAALTELKVHAALEEELFYPTVRRSVGKEVMNEADEEHHVAKLLIAELDRMDGSETHFDAKFRVLAENVRHHIKEEEEEEDEMLLKAKEAKVDFAALAEKMKRRKDRLVAGGVPPVGEEKMVKASWGRGDSPAQAAKRKPPKLSKARKAVGQWSGAQPFGALAGRTTSCRLTRGSKTTAVVRAPGIWAARSGTDVRVGQAKRPGTMAEMEVSVGAELTVLADPRLALPGRPLTAEE